MPTSLTFTQPDDWHLHLRDGSALAAVLPDSAHRFARALIMPNLKPPVTSTAQASAYRQRILTTLPSAQQPGHRFEPLMSLYLTDNTPPEEITRAKESGLVHAVKYYPAGATTHSDAGVTDITKCYLTLERMQALEVPLLIHGEVTDAHIDIFDREHIFLDRVLTPLLRDFPALRIVLEHITAQEAVQFITETRPNISATITAHHLLMNRNALFTPGIQPHHYCLPILKREKHRQALIKAATSGNPKFFLGTDSAPHARSAKESDCGCAGCYTAHAAIELYAEAFEAANALDKLEAFASFHGADFYRLPRNVKQITLVKKPWRVPSTQAFGNETLIPLRAGEIVQWQLACQQYIP